jgi:3-isopropylmalate dehydrogenase
MSAKKIAVLPGDGIGPEIIEEAIKVLNRISDIFGIKFSYSYADVGGAALDNHGEPLPEYTVKTCEDSDAVLFGAVGGPKWEKLPPDKQPERGALLPLRKHFNLYANLRPAIIFKDLKEASPLKSEIIGDGFDIMIIRELTGGIYFGQPKGKDADKGFDTLIYTRPEIIRITKVAFETAMKRNKKVTSIDKANVLSTSLLWREIVEEIAADYPEVALNHLYVDNASMQLVRDPRQFDVLLCDNMFGDILSDEASQITGSIGMLPSASLSDGVFGLYEPAGGSAPDIAGQGIANPVAQILSAAMMLKYSFGLDEAYTMIFKSIENTLEQGFRTGDIISAGKKRVGTKEIGDLILSNIKS